MPNNNMKWPLKNMVPSIPPEGHVGDFAFRRSFYYHPGIDLYCGDGQDVVAIEDGVVVHFEHFTGTNANPSSPWWNDTFAVMVEGASGVIGYCELLMADELDVGDKIKAGDLIGKITPVLKKDKGNGTTMLHLELYLSGTREHVTWVLDTAKPTELLNPRNLLEALKDDTTIQKSK
jgi:murein DD-endopeptidase MepM/ murein hydrolase activator NlpD